MSAVKTSPVIVGEKPATRRRFLILPLMFFSILFAYFDRINVSILATDTEVSHPSKYRFV